MSVSILRVQQYIQSLTKSDDRLHYHATIHNTIENQSLTSNQRWIIKAAYLLTLKSCSKQEETL